MPTKRKPARLTPAKKLANRRGATTLRQRYEAAARRDGWDKAADALKAWRNGEANLLPTAGATRKDETK